MEVNNILKGLCDVSTDFTYICNDNIDLDDIEDRPWDHVHLTREGEGGSKLASNMARAINDCWLDSTGTGVTGTIVGTYTPEVHTGEEVYPACQNLSDVDQEVVLHNLRINNIGKVIVWHLNVNSVVNKFEELKVKIKGNIDILVLTEFQDFFTKMLISPFRLLGS